MQDYTIQPDEKAGRKGRSFSAKCSALITANHLWDSGAGDTIRPIWAQFIGSDAELRPFATNLKLGRKAEPSRGRSSAGDRLEFKKSANYQLSWQREPEGTILTLFHPDLFRLDPGMVDPGGASFVMLTPRWWVAAQDVPGGDPPARASLFAAMLDRRTRWPLPADVAFYQQLLAAALDQGLALTPGDRSVNYSHSFAAEGLEQAGLDMNGAIAFSATHETLEAFLAEQCTEFFAAQESE
jgi:hypothetical protein